MATTIPKTKKEAFAQLDDLLGEEERLKFANTKDVIAYHFSLGMWIRNNWIYEQSEEDVNMLGNLFLKDMIFIQPDDLSEAILSAYHRHARARAKRETKLFIMAKKQDIVNYLSQATRNRLVFCHDTIEGITFVDLGKELSERLVKENPRSPQIAFAAEDALNEILSSTNNDDGIGFYVALENIGILFEPSLAFNLKSTLDNASTNKVVIIQSNGVIKSDCFYFLQEGDDSIIDLRGLSYIEI